MGKESSNVLEEILPKWVLQKEEVSGEDVLRRLRVHTASQSLPRWPTVGLQQRPPFGRTSKVL